MNVNTFGEFGGDARGLRQGQRVRVKRTADVGLIRDLWENHVQLEFVRSNGSSGYSVYGVYLYSEFTPLTPLEQLAEAAE